MWDNGEVLVSQLRSCGFDPYTDRTIHQLRVYILEKSSVLIADNIA